MRVKFLACVAVAIAVIHPCIKVINFPDPGPDCDTQLIERGIADTHTFADTWRWWHGTWVGQVPFWRPLTSYVFYLESKTIGLEDWKSMMAVSVIPHLFFVILLYFYTLRVTRSHWVALLAVVWFAGWKPPIGDYTNQTVILRNPAMAALVHWKNQPDSLVGIFILATALCAMKCRWLPAVLFSFIAVCIKESGWLAMPVAFISIAMVERGFNWLKSIPWHIILLGMIFAAMLVALRFLSGHDVWHGYHMGTNMNWAVRYSKAAFGYLFSSVLTDPRRWPIGVLSIITILTLTSRFKGSYKALGVATAALLCSICLGGGDLAVGVIAMFTPSCYLLELLYATIWACAAYDAITGSHRRVVPYMVAMELLLVAPFAAASQVLEHALYVAYAFQAILVAQSLWSVARKRLRPHAFADTADA